MSHVFISYSKKDKEYARKLADKLIELGFDVWIDDRIDFGDEWELAIFDAIDRCAAILVVMTPDAYESRWVRRECQYAEKRNKPPFPVLLKGEEFPRYGITQYVDVRDGELPSAEFYDRLEKNAPRKTERGIELEIIATLPGAHMNIAGDLQATHIEASEIDLPPAPDLSGILPEPFEWCYVPAGYVNVKYSDTTIRTFDIPSFYMAKYPITNKQFQKFVDFSTGYKNPKIWEFSEEAKAWHDTYTLEETSYSGSDLPRTYVSFYEAQAFCHWLGTLKEVKNTSFVIRLPTEQHWQRAAQGNGEHRCPWGDDFDANRCNTIESSVGQPTRVTRYSNGASPFEVMDMAGNVREWCMVELPAKRQGLRGGAFNLDKEYAKSDFHDSEEPHLRADRVGFRIEAFLINRDSEI